jgi:hypothetical protein
MQDTDYKALLEKYMRHVAQCEGIDFTDRLNDRSSGTVVKFTPEEVQALEAVSALISKNLWPEV